MNGSEDLFFIDKYKILIYFYVCVCFLQSIIKTTKKINKTELIICLDNFEWTKIVNNNNKKHRTLISFN